MTIQHGLKIVSFAALGFAFGPYIPLLVGLVLCSFIDSYAGKLALNRLPERIFRVALKTTLTIYRGKEKTLRAGGEGRTGEEELLRHALCPSVIPAGHHRVHCLNEGSNFCGHHRHRNLCGTPEDRQCAFDADLFVRQVCV
jgi:hypothetical protein